MSKRSQNLYLQSEYIYYQSVVFGVTHPPVLLIGDQSPSHKSSQRKTVLSYGIEITIRSEIDTLLMKKYNAIILSID